MLRDLTAYLAVFIGGVALLTAINVWLLCLADPKFGGGCTGFGLYFPQLVLGMLAFTTLRFVMLRREQHGAGSPDST